jgi:KipI family sensor histidine kinase inhibitor
VRRPRHLKSFGRAALLLEWEQRIDDAISQSVTAYASVAATLPGVTECIPAYASLLVRFSPQMVNRYDLGDRLLSMRVAPTTICGPFHRIPVCYADPFAPDAEVVCQHCGIDRQQLVRLHTAEIYRVYFLGYQPGFGFLGRTPEVLRVARRPSPRVRVPVGSVGLAGRQTGVYPTASPGGWQLIGNCPLPFLRADGLPRLRAGDQVRFYSISPDQHVEMTEQSQE